MWPRLLGIVLGIAFTIGSLATDAAPMSRGGIRTAATAETETVLHTFGATAGDATQPLAGLVGDGTGNLYGTTLFGGSLNHGTVFMLIKGTSGYTEAVLHSFGTAPNASDGANPTASLAIDTSGNLYGTTKYGGAGSGVVFKLSPGKTGWSETVLHTFAGSNDGANPVAGLVADGSGNLYGTTQAGGTAGDGVAFMLLRGSSGWTEGILHNFGTSSKGSDGVTPVAGLVLDTKGNAYGTTLVGGVGYGVVYKLSPGSAGWTETVLHTFSGGSDGANPKASVVLDGSGNLYGTTFNGGAGYGLAFLLKSGSWSETVLHDFATSPGASDGANPAAGVILGGVSPTGYPYMFGTTEGGGVGYGTAFVIGLCPSVWTETIIYTFASTANPIAGLFEDTLGNLYGTTQGGGIGSGVAFELTESTPSTSMMRGVRPQVKRRGC